MSSAGSIGPRPPPITATITTPIASIVTTAAALIATAIPEAVATINIQKCRPAFIVGRQIQQGANRLDRFATAAKHATAIGWVECHAQPHIISRVLAVNA